MICRLALIALLWPLASTAQTAPVAPTAAGQFRISGTVVDRVSGAPLARTVVSLGSNTSYSISRAVMTGPDGRFAFDRLAPGKYSLQARRRGYVQQGFEQHEQFWTGIAVGPGLASTGLLFRITPAASISGRILDERSEPVANARVSVFRSELSGGSVTQTRVMNWSSDDLGYYFVHDLAPGRYRIVVEAVPWYSDYSSYGFPGSAPANEPPAPTSELDVTYPLIYYPNTTDAASASDIRLAAGQRFVADFRLAATPAYKVRLHTGAPPNSGAYANLDRYTPDGEEQPLTAVHERTTDDVVEFSGVAAGDYVVKVYQPSGHSAWRKQIHVAGDTDVDGSAVPAGATITGAAHFEGFEDEQKPAGPVLALLPKEGGNAHGVGIDESGALEIEDQVDPGVYTLEARPGIDLSIARIVATGARVSGTRVEIAGSDPVELQVFLTAGSAQVTGTAMRGDKPAPAAMILLMPADAPENDDLVRRDQSDSDGTFALRGIVPGRYVLMAIQDGWDLEWAKPEVLKPYLAHAQRLEIRASGKYDVRVPVQ